MNMLNRLPALLRTTGPAFRSSMLLLVAAACLYAFALRPLAKEATRAEAQLRQLIDRQGTPVFSQGSAQRDLQRFYAFFQRDEHITDALAELKTIAQAEGFELAEANYSLTSYPATRLFRYQMNFTVRGTYPQLREFLEHSLQRIPVLSLDELRFQRKTSDDQQIEAQVRVSFFSLGDDL